jgi:hypothetical protein
VRRTTRATAARARAKPEHVAGTHGGRRDGDDRGGAWPRRGLGVARVIVDRILELLETILGWALAPFPDDSTAVIAHVTDMAGNLGALNYFLPIAETFAVVVGVLVIFPGFMGISLSLWIIAQLRGSSSVG